MKVRDVLQLSTRELIDLFDHTRKWSKLANLIEELEGELLGSKEGPSTAGIRRAAQDCGISYQAAAAFLQRAARKWAAARRHGGAAV